MSQHSKYGLSGNRGDAKMEAVMVASVIIVAAFVIFNQIQISGMTNSLSGGKSSGWSKLGGSSENVDLDDVNVLESTSTAMTLSIVMPEVHEITGEADAMALLPSGTPEYTDALGGISFDDPVTSMEYLAKWYNTINADVQKNNPEVWTRYLNLATKPVGISCEYCCGIGPIGITEDGRSRCGCQHNPALLALTLGLMQETEYNDAEVMREVMKWKTMFFPRDMLKLSLEVAGQDPASLKDLPGMVGGC